MASRLAQTSWRIGFVEPVDGPGPPSRRVRIARPVLFLLSLAAVAAASSFASPAWARDESPGRGGPGKAVDPDRFDVVVLDAGHGGHDDGATGPSGLHEKDLVLDVTKRLARRLRRSGIRVILTRSSDEFLSLEQRTAVANDARADLFLSIHANASPSRKPRGVETYFASLDATDDAARATAERENDAFGHAGRSFDPADPLTAILGDLIETEHLLESSEFAKLAQAELSEVVRARPRGVKQAPFVVLMGVRMPSSLVEIGFLTNPDEEKKLRRKRRRDALAKALAEAVLTFAERYDRRRGVSLSARSGSASTR